MRDGQTSRRPVIEINIKGLFLYRYFKCPQARTGPRLLTLVDDSFFLPITSCARFQVAVGYLLTKATSGFPESCLFFQASGHYITLWFLGRLRVLVWRWGNQLGGAVASVTPNPNCSSSSPGKSLLDEGGAIQNVAKWPRAGLWERHSDMHRSGHDAADSCPMTWMGSYPNSLLYEETRATSMAEL